MLNIASNINETNLMVTIIETNLNAIIRSILQPQYLGSGIQYHLNITSYITQILFLEVGRGKGRGGVGRGGQGGFEDIERQCLPMVYEAAVANYCGCCCYCFFL